MLSTYPTTDVILKISWTDFSGRTCAEHDLILKISGMDFMLRTCPTTDLVPTALNAQGFRRRCGHSHDPTSLSLLSPQTWLKDSKHRQGRLKLMDLFQAQPFGTSENKPGVRTGQFNGRRAPSRRCSRTRTSHWEFDMQTTPCSLLGMEGIRKARRVKSTSFATGLTAGAEVPEQRTLALLCRRRKPSIGQKVRPPNWDFPRRLYL